MSVYYVQTSDAARVVRVQFTEHFGHGVHTGVSGPEPVAEVVANPFPTVASFSLANTLRTSAMQEARDAAHAEGLKLRNVKVIAVRGN